MKNVKTKKKKKNKKTQNNNRCTSYKTYKVCEFPALMQYESVFGAALHNVATVSFNMAAERVSTSSVVKLNLSAIKKSDQYVVNIIDNASQVALYKFNGTTQAWVSTAQLIFLHVWS